MPYVSPYGTKRVPIKFSSNLKGKTLTAKQKNQVKTLVSRRQELKQIVYLFGASVSSSGTLQGCADVVQGPGGSTRDGNRLQWCGKMELRFTMINALAASDPYNHLRIIIFQWHPNSTPTAVDILQAGPFGGTYDYLSLYNHNNRQEYKILFDRTYKTCLNTTETIPYELTQTRSAKISLKKASKYVQFVDATAAGTNRMYVLWLTDSNIAVHPTVYASIRTFYRDS